MYKQIIRPILSVFNQENAHDLFLKLVRFTNHLPVLGSLVRLTHKYERAELHRGVFGMDFKNPVGLAAGFDTDAECLEGLSAFGFSFIEVGSLSCEKQEGGKKPRTVRDKSRRGIITRPGNRNKGIKNAIENLKNNNSSTILFGSIAPNQSSHKDEEMVEDYCRAFSLLYDFVDVIVVNVSCPNDNGLLFVQDGSSLSDVIDPLLEIRLCYEKHKPILIKLSPDTPFEQIDRMLDYCRLNGIDGVIAGNYSKCSREVLAAHKMTDSAVLSVEELFPKSRELVKHINGYTQGRFPIIGCGGIMSPAQAKEMMDAGASLIQLYSGIEYEGPKLVKRILKSI